MALVDKHPPGSFCWIELATTDQNAAKNFYTSLFGWAVTDNPMGPGEFYSIFKLKGRDVAAGYTIRKDQSAQGVTPNWSLYIAVESADQTAAKAAPAGGKVLAPAFDVMDAGRMAVLQDPTGAVFCVWQAKRNQGIGVASEPGAFCWADLSSPDPERAAKFYSAVLGWKVEKPDASGYLHIKNGESFIGGMLPTTHRDPKTPPHWLTYFMIPELASSASKAAQLGAKTLVQRQHMEGVGSWSIVADPQGAVFALFEYAPR